MTPHAYISRHAHKEAVHFRSPSLRLSRILQGTDAQAHGQHEVGSGL
jgi:hypothetical protein